MLLYFGHFFKILLYLHFPTVEYNSYIRLQTQKNGKLGKIRFLENQFTNMIILQTCNKEIKAILILTDHCFKMPILNLTSFFSLALNTFRY